MHATLAEALHILHKSAPPDDVEEGEGQRSLHERAEEEKPLFATTELELDRLSDVVGRDARQSLHVRHDLVLEVDLELAVHGLAGCVGGVEVFAQARVCGVHGVAADAGLAQYCNRQWEIQLQIWRCMAVSETSFCHPMFDGQDS